MEKEVFISAFLDTRRKLKTNKYPLKIRVFTRYPRKQKLYPTKFEFTEKEFNSIWNTVKPTNEVKPTRAEIQSLLDKADEKAAQLNPFTFDAFDRLFYLRAGEPENIFYQYDQVISRLSENKQIGTASNYSLSKRSIQKFLQDKTGTDQEPEKLLFREVTPQWLNRYEAYMTRKGKSPTTISMYLRALRTLFNAAISEGIIQQDIYPFGRRKYEIPNHKAVKKALNQDQLKQLYNAIPANPEQVKAKDYFFFLFNTAGMNVKDMARMKYENLKGDTLTYTREKTKRTAKANLKQVIVYLNPFALEFIDRHGNPDRQPQNYIFDIYTPGMTEAEQFRISHNFTRFINQHLKELAKANGLPEEISTYWSRHSFATNAIRNGASLELVSQALNHSDTGTTMNYFAGFEPVTMKDLTANLMNFLTPPQNEQQDQNNSE